MPAFEAQVWQQWQLRDPADCPSEDAVREAVEFMRSLGVGLVADSLRLAAFIDHLSEQAYQRGLKDGSESVKTSSATKALVGFERLWPELTTTFRESFLGTSVAPCSAGEDVSAFLVRLSAGSAMTQGLCDLTLLANTEVSAVVSSVFTGQPLGFSAVDRRTISYWIILASGGLFVDLSGLFPTTGHIQEHAWRSYLTSVRQAFHPPGQWVWEPADDTDALFAFVEEQQSTWGWKSDLQLAAFGGKRL